jgi:hypothetical protein
MYVFNKLETLYRWNADAIFMPLSVVNALLSSDKITLHVRHN